jgi:hypothetical protein
MLAFQQEAQSSLLLFVLSSPTGRRRRSTSLTPASLSSSSSSKLSRVDDEHKNTRSVFEKRNLSFTQNTTTLKGRLYVFKVNIRTEERDMCKKSLSLSLTESGVVKLLLWFQTKNLSVSARAKMMR